MEFGNEPAHRHGQRLARPKSSRPAQIPMVSSADEIRTNALSERIIGCAFRVLNTLGPGFLEKV